MKVIISKRATADAERIAKRWSKEADDPSVFPREFEAAIEHLGTVNHPGTPFPTRKRPKLKRLLLEKSLCHIYFELDAKKQRINVLTVWSGQRGGPPKL